jgi:hypothetical protein
MKEVISYHWFLTVDFDLSAEAIPGKAVIYMWHDEEDGNQYHHILLAIVHSVIGGPSRSSRLSQLKVQIKPDIRN